MIQHHTELVVCDNTGARTAVCIKVLGGTHRRYASVGDIIVAAVKKVQPGSEFMTTSKKGQEEAGGEGRGCPDAQGCEARGWIVSAV